MPARRRVRVLVGARLKYPTSGSRTSAVCSRPTTRRRRVVPRPAFRLGNHDSPSPDRAERPIMWGWRRIGDPVHAAWGSQPCLQDLAVAWSDRCTGALRCLGSVWGGRQWPSPAAQRGLARSCCGSGDAPGGEERKKKKEGEGIEGEGRKRKKKERKRGEKKKKKRERGEEKGREEKKKGCCVGHLASHVRCWAHAVALHDLLRGQGLNSFVGRLLCRFIWSVFVPPALPALHFLRIGDSRAGQGRIAIEFDSASYPFGYEASEA